ncbi:MAG: hypothetical protein D6736_20635 [Nitrospinota bacterium]|nr:MAG: hypothetical protein D6736_20635 [Nitrospinota bacterium]
MAELVTRFGFPPDLFDPYLFLEQGRSIWVLRQTPYLEEVLTVVQRRVETAGLRLLRRIQTQWKPTTYGLQLFGPYATRNIVTLNDAEVRILFTEGRVRGPFALEEGYVIINSSLGVLGCGLYRGETLRSQIPRPRSRLVTSF